MQSCLFFGIKKKHNRVWYGVYRIEDGVIFYLYPETFSLLKSRGEMLNVQE